MLTKVLFKYVPIFLFGFSIRIASAQEEWMVQKISPEIIKEAHRTNYNESKKTSENIPYTKNYLHIRNKIADERLKYLYNELDYRVIENPNWCPILKSSFLKRFDVNKTCSRIDYESQNFSSYSVLLSSNSSRHNKLVLYNHGHDGLPLLNHEYTTTLFDKLLSDNYDILLISMPFIGANFIDYPIILNTTDGPGVFDPSELQWPYVPHMLFTMLEVGKSHYMRFFIDDSIIFSLMHPNYKNISYVGLSGGATIGTVICSALANIINSCILQSGVMPISLRLRNTTIGDLEQVDSSFWGRNTVYDQLKNMEIHGVITHLIYNDNDECCFRGSDAEKFKETLIKRNINPSFIIRKNDKHNYDPIVVYQMIVNKYEIESIE